LFYNDNDLYLKTSGRGEDIQTVRVKREYVIRILSQILHVYTMLPTLHGKHVMPIQTVTIMCSAMKKSLNLLEKEDIFLSNNDNYDHIIVWHHREIPKILQKYFKYASFVWDDDNYYGCLLMDEK
jgi:hypothetical protein